MASQKRNYTRASTIEVVLHSPNPQRLAAQVRPGSGAHRTDCRNNRRIRREGRDECRQSES